MSQTTPQTNPHLAEARRLLDMLQHTNDAQAMASAATAHAILVLAEQVAAARITMAPESVRRQPQTAAAA